MRLCGLGGAVTHRAVVSNGGFFPSLGNSSHRSAGGVFDTTRFVLNSHGGLSPWIRGAGWANVSTMQMHYTESRGYPGMEAEEESTGSTPVALDLSYPRSWKTQGQDVVSLGFYCTAYLSPFLPPVPVSIIPLQGVPFTALI